MAVLLNEEPLDFESRGDKLNCNMMGGGRGSFS